MKLGTVVWIGYGPFYVADAGPVQKYKPESVLAGLHDPALIPSAIARAPLMAPFDL